MYKEFYSWRRILQRLPQAKSQRTAYLLFNLAYRKYGRVTAMLGKLGLMNTIGRLARRLSYASPNPPSPKTIQDTAQLISHPQH